MPRVGLIRRSTGLAATCLLVLSSVAGSGPTPQTSSQTPPRTDRQLTTQEATTPRRQYLALAERYCRGDVEAVLQEIDSWDWRAFTDIRRDLRQYGEWTPRDLQCVVMLHTDRALRAQAGSLTETSHLNSARELLHLFDGQPLLDRSARLFRRDWYVAVAAHLHGQLRFIELDELLRDAVRVFPDDAAVLLAWGLMREAQTSPRLSAVAASLPGRSETFLGPFPDRRGALREAEEYFRRALARDPTLIEARVRLGRVLGARGRSGEGLETLAAVRAQSPDQRAAYLASLFVGQILAQQSRLPEAAEAYWSASALYPQCQAATIALSFVVREMGNREESVRLVRQALEQGASEACEDPWWDYDFGLGPQADAMFDRLREKARQ